MKQIIRNFVREEEGGFIEYLIVALVIALGVYAVSSSIKTSLQTKGGSVQTGINGIN